jgi:hypothetical protein
MCGGNQGARVADLAADVISRSVIKAKAEALTCFPFPVNGRKCNQRPHENGDVRKRDRKSNPIDIEHVGRVVVVKGDKSTSSKSLGGGCL